MNINRYVKYSPYCRQCSRRTNWSQYVITRRELDCIGECVSHHIRVSTSTFAYKFSIVEYCGTIWIIRWSETSSVGERSTPPYKLEPRFTNQTCSELTTTHQSIRDWSHRCMVLFRPGSKNRRWCTLHNKSILTSAKVYCERLSSFWCLKHIMH